MKRSQSAFRQPSQLRLSNGDAHHYISEQLSHLFSDAIEGYSCTRQTVSDMVVKASVTGAAIEGTCNALADAPTGMTVRSCLNDALSVTELQEIECKMRTLVKADLPKRLWKWLLVHDGGNPLVVMDCRKIGLDSRAIIWHNIGLYQNNLIKEESTCAVRNHPRSDSRQCSRKYWKKSRAVTPILTGWFYVRRLFSTPPPEPTIQRLHNGLIPPQTLLVSGENVGSRQPPI